MKISTLAIKAFITVVLAVPFYAANAQNQDYFREGFATINTATSAPAGPNDVVRRDTTATSPNTWVSYGAYRTTGTACSFGTAQHIRFTVNVTADTPYLITPYVNYGIKEFHFMRSRASRSYSIYKTYDTLGTTTNWIYVTTTPNSPNTCANGAADTTININDALAKRIKINNTSMQDADIDSVWLTSVNAILPVKFTTVNASETSGKVKLSWNIAAEADVAKYVVERSSNNITFNEVGSLVATQSSSYNWVDNTPAGGNNFYRIRAIDKDGSSLYTSVVKVALGNKLSELTIAPNPIRSHTLNLQLSNFDKGVYSINIFNGQGQKVFSGSLNHVGGSATQTFQLPAGIKSGMYSLQFVNGTTVINKNVVVE
jgi:hypothetical protein